MSGGVVPGWYADPADPARERWWAGDGWSDRTRPAVVAGGATYDGSPTDAFATVHRPSFAPGDQGPVQPPPGQLPADARRSNTPLIVVAAVLLVVVLGVGIVIVAMSASDQEPTARVGLVTTSAPSVAPTTIPPVASDSAAVAPDSAQAPAPTVPPPPSPGVRTATVSRTCGMSGNGDCFLSVRASPSARSTEIDRLTEGASTTAVCQVVGESVRSSVLGRATNVWVRDAKGRYMSAAFLDGDGWNPQEVTTPCP